MFHVEAINPVALGKTRAKQYSLLGSSSSDCMLGDKVMCVQLHGDASFTGQGVVMEGLGLSESGLSPESVHQLTSCRQFTTFHYWWYCAHRCQVHIYFFLLVKLCITD